MNGDECSAKLCNGIFNLCVVDYPNNSTMCQERADGATHCCYNCLECPSQTADKPNPPHYDHCLNDLCNNIYQVCTKSDHGSEECRDASNVASGCCNMCDDCN
jgi:hypothetical protein